MKDLTITANYIKTICWKGDTIIDWAQGGQQYLINGEVTPIHTYFPFSFDRAITSNNSEYVFIYQNLGTKGLLLKNGELIREINRTYYFAGTYEFPAAFITLDHKTYLIHCPIAYNQLDFEDVETGEVITNTKDRKPKDLFHSRLEISTDGNYLMSKGWVWHPVDKIIIFDIKACIKDPLLLDGEPFYPPVGVEICSASFIDDHTVVIGSSNEVFDDNNLKRLPPKHICSWNFKKNSLSKPVEIKVDFGNLFAINATYAWDMFRFPKIINIRTGEVMKQNKEINSGEQRSSIVINPDSCPSIIFNKQTAQIAIKAKEQILLLTPDLH